MKALLLASLMFCSLLSPAIAADETPTEVSLPNPWLAGGLSMASPILLGAVTFPAFGVGSPFGFGAGHIYAGDSGRALWVSLGGLSAVLAAGAYGLYGPTEELRPRRLQQAVVNASITSMVYSLWAGYDAFQTAERQRAELAGE